MRKVIAASAALLALAGCAQMGASDKGDGWTTLFDGSSMTGWHPVGDANWHLENGAVVANKGSGFLIADREYGDFDLKVEFYAEADTNSGLFLRCAANDKMLDSKMCYEVNIWDVRPAPEYGTGAIVDVAKVTPAMPKAGGKWNTYEVSMRGDHLVVTLNGVKTADAHDTRRAKGYFGLQYAPGNKKDSGLPIKFRKVQIRAS